MTDWRKPCLNIGTGHGKRTAKQPQSFREFIKEVEAGPKERRKGKTGHHPNSVAARGRVDRYYFPTPEGRCSFTGKSGVQCKNWKMRGASRCRLHGGYRQNPTHPATMRLLRKGALHDRLAAKDATHALSTQANPDTRIHVSNTLQAAGRKLNNQTILQGCQAYEINDNGKAWRRWLSIIRQEI